MKIRDAHARDVEALSAIATQTFALACPPDTPAAELQRYIDDNLTPAAFASVLENRACDVRVLENDGIVAGFSVVNRSPDVLHVQAADGMAELTRCYVLPAFHGTGAAQHLLTATLSHVSGLVRLMVNDQNARAIRFYCRNGFVEVGATSFQCGDDVHRDLIMVRRM